MEVLAIATVSYEDSLKTQLLEETSVHPMKDIQICERHAGNVHVLSVVTSEHPEEDWLSQCKELASRVIGTTVVTRMEEDLLRSLLERCYGGFSPGERRRILQRAQERLDAGPRGRGVYRADRIRRVTQVARAYLADAQTVHLEGFVRFRLRAYLSDLEEAVGQAVDDVLARREYREFIRLLRYFVASQPPRTGQVHLYVRGAQFEIFAADGRRLEGSPPGLVELDAGDVEVHLEDLLISTLIEASPRRIVLHAPDGTASRHVETVRRVFGERLTRCTVRPCVLCDGRQALTGPPRGS